MKIVTMDEAQTQLPALLAAVEATGESVLIPSALSEAFQLMHCTYRTRPPLG